MLRLMGFVTRRRVRAWKLSCQRPAYRERLRYMRLVFALIPAVAFGQTAFEVASIKPAPPQEFGRTSVHRSSDKEPGIKGRLKYEGVSLSDLLADSHRLQHHQISGPDWLSSQRFDIMAVIPAAFSEAQIPEMLAALLVERFGLKTHDETKEMQVYTLEPAKGGAKLKKAESAGGVSGKSTKTTERVSARTTMAGLADYLSGRMDRPVVDRTGLEGPYEIELEWTPDTVATPGAEAPGPSIFTAIQEQLGLRLSAGKAPVRLLVVDHIDKTPTDN